MDDASDDDPWEYLRSIIPEGGSLDPLFSLLSEFFFAYRFDEVSRYGEYHFSYSCIWMENRFVLCPKYTYTAIQQRQIELLLHDTFSAFTDVWYQILSDDSFTQRSYRQGFYDDRLDTLLERIPPGNTPSWHRNTHHATFAQTLLDSSFSLGAQYRFENTLLAVLDRHVAEMAEQKCWEVLNEGVCSSKQGTILRYFIPSQEEIFEEEIFHNGDAVQISSLQDEILFRITASEEKYPENDDITLSPETIRHFRTP